MEIDAVKELRQLTNLSIGEIKKALDRAGGDKDKTLAALKEQGAVIAAQKNTRNTGEGIVDCYVHANKKIGVLLELLCETDFVAKNPMFSELSHELALHIAAMDPADAGELLKQPYVRDQNLTVDQFVNQFIAKLGENIRIGNFTRFQI